MSENDVEYWSNQVEGALEQMGIDAGVTERLNATDVAISLKGGSTREQRAHLIQALELRGFTITSESDNEWIYVDASPERLNHGFVEGGEA